MSRSSTKIFLCRKLNCHKRIKNGAQKHNEKVLTLISKYCQEHKKNLFWLNFICKVEQFENSV